VSRWMIAGLGSMVAAGVIGVGLAWRANVANAATTSVSTDNYFFSPSSLTVNVGDTVTWTNPTGIQHTSTSDTGVWSSPVLNPGGVFSFTFMNPGVFSYHCTFHSGFGMVGTITVLEAATPTTSVPSTPTPTAGPSGSVGGRGFTLGLGSIDMSWIGGTLQAGYIVGKLSLTSGLTILPSSGPLPASAVSFSDTSPLTDPAYCYAVLPLGASGLLGQSDLLCVLPNTAAGAGAATNFSIQLNQSSTATLRWVPPSNAAQFFLAAIPLNGAPVRTISLSSFQTTTTDSTLGVPTCYVLVSLSAAGASANPPILCGVPGFSNLGA